MKKAFSAEKLIKITKELLYYWLVDQDKEKTYLYFMSLLPQERVLVRTALKDILTKSPSEEFRQAAYDIPQYIKSKL